MATSAFKSTTKRASLGCSSSRNFASSSLRRSRSLSRFSHHIPSDQDTETDYNKNAPRGKFVNTTRGSTAVPFPEISLDDLALEFSSSSKNGNDSSDGAGTGQKEREERSVSRRGEIGRWARDTASSRRRGRSVSRTRTDDVVSDASVSGVKKVVSSDTSSRRRRSLSVARFQISDSESEVDHSRSKGNFATAKAPLNGNRQISSAQKTMVSGTRRLGKSQSHKDLSFLHDGYSLKKHKQDLLTEMLLEEQRDQEVSKMVKELPHSRSSAVAEKPSRARKRSSDRNKVSKKLIEEAERYFEDFICNIEDSDISSFDGERCGGNLTLGGKMKERDDARTMKEADQTRKANHTSQPVEMDGVILPWLQWETSHDNGYPLGTNNTPNSLQRESNKDTISFNDPSSHSFSSQDSWSPSVFSSPSIVKREDAYKTAEAFECLGFDMDEYLKHGNNELLLFEMYRQRTAINSAGMLLCTMPQFM